MGTLRLLFLRTTGLGDVVANQGEVHPVGLSLGRELIALGRAVLAEVEEEIEEVKSEIQKVSKPKGKK